MREILTTFQFKKYVTNAWYFILFPKERGFFSTSFYQHGTYNFSEEEKKLIHEDSNYKTQIARDFDIGYQAWNRGIMLTCDTEKIVENTYHPSLSDEYRFIRKYYKRIWIYNIFLLRILSFHNPVKEISAFFSSRNMKRIKLYEKYNAHKKYSEFQSKIVEEKPKVSVIIPTLNRYKYLIDAITDLEHQTVPLYELIVIDQSDVVDENFYKQFSIKIKLITQEGKGQWLARNAAIKQAEGEWLLFFDDDSRVGNDWIEQHLKGCDFFNAEISAGVSLSKVGDKIPANYSFFRWADQFDSGNALVHKNVFKKTGLFDMQYDRMRMGDGEFGIRAYLNGFKSISHPYAKRIHLKVNEGGLRAVGSWDAFRTGKFLAPIPIPSVTYFYRTYFPKNMKLMLLNGFINSAIPYKFKNKRYLLPIGLLFAVIKSPVLAIQFYKSLSRSKKMLNKGSLIEKI